MSDASRETQKAIVAALKADATLNAIISGRIYAKPPLNATKPYVSVGPQDWANTEGVGQESHAGSLQYDAWSIASSQEELERVAGAVQNVLHEAALTLDTQRLVMLLHRVTRYFTEADGITMHAAMDFAAYTQKPPP